MQQSRHLLHPNPGWSNPEPQTLSGTLNSDKRNMLGKHCILELYECDQSKLNDEYFLRNAITAAAKNSGATLIKLITH